ncbi:von Willebrand factor A domain-containing protein 7-like isoform X1 [Nerophis ophidion]|uniref:von Willebrand factor A domain-containing protein 7-like isoform X1 n=2 Tax=Nerophis ophidion TaxID=159077 RepID=UPI002ADF3AE5|nr:von Willebrand factor A domain-containing protein 7-like isoform X1 [Nerophis ophidion]
MATVGSVLLPLAVVFALTDPTRSFDPLTGASFNHRNITERAILRKVAEVCRDIAAGDGVPFDLTIDDSLTPDQVVQACFTPTSLISSVSFIAVIAEIYLSNGGVDLRFANRAEYHFNDETFEMGRTLITEGVSAVKASTNGGNFITARLVLGEVLHTLQDFYSHSNWVELGNTVPYDALITPALPLENLAGPTVPTCTDCINENCTDNILPAVLDDGLLISGYFDTLSSNKPEGKCSQGGPLDLTSTQEPVGGINKDTFDSDHGFLHQEAADLALNASLDLLEDIRIGVRDQNFLRVLGVFSAPVLCFVIDTTGSMGPEIAEVKRVSIDIITSRLGTGLEPPFYILVPFNDPEFGPVTQSSDPDLFIERINELTAFGGGGTPELSLSGLQLALTAAPPFSEIFLFTDAPFRDVELRPTILALIANTRSRVTFMLTDVLSFRRKRELEGLAPRVVTQTQAELYREIALASGGLTIEVPNSDLSMVTVFIEDSIATAVVTVFQETKNPGAACNFSFFIDDTLRNITILLTGTPSLDFTLRSPTGTTQTSSGVSGPLASFSLAGNFRRLRLNDDSETGLWEISVNSTDPYSVKVIGQSSLDFIYNIVEVQDGASTDFFRREGRPISGGNVSLLVTLTRSDGVSVTQVALLNTLDGTEVNGTLQAITDSTYVVTFSNFTGGTYVVVLRGVASNSTSRMTPGSFQRQAPTQITTSNIVVNALPNITVIEPGSSATIPFTVALISNGEIDQSAMGTFTVSATNDRGFPLTSPSTVTIGADSGGIANGTVTLGTSKDALSGSDVTLTIAAGDAAAINSNDVVLRFPVFRVTDISAPVCLGNTSSNCPANESICGSFMWDFITTVTDGVNGTDVEVNILEGNGTLETSTGVGPDGENITVVSYTASCCAGRVVLSAVDNAGNVGRCVGQARESDLEIVAPVCFGVNATACPSNMSLCDSTQWSFVINVTDSDGTGIANITVSLGDGTLNTSTEVGPDGEVVSVASYTGGSCCAERVVLAATDNSGNVGFCSVNAREADPPLDPPPTFIPVDEGDDGETDGGETLNTLPHLWMAAVVLLLWI